MSGKYQAYPEYKDSGVEWFGEMPAHWRSKPLKYFAQFINGNAFKPSEWSASGTPIIRIENLNGGESFNFFEGDVHDRYCVKKGDLLFGWSGNKGTSFGPFIWWRDGQYYLNQHIFRLDGFHCHKRWFYWVLKAATYFIEEQAHGIIGMIHVTKARLGGLCIPSIVSEEQRTIAAFLDHETARIDRLIEKQQRLIELLKEKRQAVISHAVTKGLDPNVPMKNSGVEWLGQVPEHWKVIAIKHLSPVFRGASPRPIDDPKYFDDDGTFAWVRIADVSAAGMYLEDTTQTLSQLGSSLSVKIYPGDLFVSIAGTVGKPCISKIRACIHDGFVYFPKLAIPPLYLYYIFAGGEAYKGLGKMGTQLNLNTETVGGIKVALPPKEEIKQILQVLTVDLMKVNTLIDKANFAIELLQERRTALISAAVTGKIDVRNWQPSTGTQTAETALPMAAEQAGRYHV